LKHLKAQNEKNPFVGRDIKIHLSFNDIYDLDLYDWRSSLDVYFLPTKIYM